MDYSVIPDKNLIKLIKSKHESDIDYGFECIYYKYAKLLYVCIFGIVKNQEDAQDLVNETFLSVFNSRDKLIEEKNLKYYLVVSAKNKAYTFMKTKKEVYKDDEYIYNELIDENVSLADIISEMKVYLNDYEIDLVLKHIVYEMTFEEIAKVQNEKLSTIKSRYYNALDKCKD